MTGRRSILIAWLMAVISTTLHAYDIPGFTPDEIVVYKQTTDSAGDPVSLHLNVFMPPGHQPSHQRPAIVFFFGGGWVSGSPSQFHPHCEYLASRGMVAISAEYRVESLHGTTPRECVKDGKSAVRYLREHAAELGIDPNRIAAGGGSAGGQVAAATGTLAAYEEPGEDLGVSSKPNALILFNPVIDNGPGGYGYDRVQAYWEYFSPLNNIDAAAPATVFFLGTADTYIPVSTAQNYKNLMEAEGRRCDLHIYEGQPHGFFNYDMPDDGKGPYPGFRDTMFKTDEFLVSLGYLNAPRNDPFPVTDWVAIHGDAELSGSATAAPVTSDADNDCIAANFDPVTLADNTFVRMTGTVTFDALLTGGGLQIGLFRGDTPVTSGDGAGYVGLWAEAPATADTSLAASDGAGTSHPFEKEHSAVLGPVPAAATAAPAGTPVDFALMIARNGDQLDISADFSDGVSYHASQNLLDIAVAEYSFDSIALLMSEDLNATQAAFSNIGIESGPVLPAAESGGGVPDAITYVDAVEGTSGNTYASGGSLPDTSWVGPDSSTESATQWNKRLNIGGSQGDTVFQGASSTTPPPELTTQITGLADGDYTLWAFYWDQIDSDTQNWVLSAGLTAGALATYSSPGQPAVAGATTSDVTYAGDLKFTTAVNVDGYNEGDPTLLRRLFGVNLGQVTVSGGAFDVHIGNNLLNGTGNRAWYEGVGHQPAMSTTYTRLLGVEFNRDDALGSPSQSGFRIVSGSAASQTANAPSYTKKIGAYQVTLTQPDGANFEFRGANTDGIRAIPGGDTSRSYLVSDFIATREGSIDIRITGLAAGSYRFRSWHLDTFTGSALGFAQGTTTSTPNLIEAQTAGLTRDAVEPTALGTAGLNTTFINDNQIPALDFMFTHDGTSPLVVKLRAVDSNGSERFLLLNGFELLEETP